MKNYWNNGIFGLCKASPSPTGRRLGFLLVFYAASIILFWMGRTFFVARCFQLDSPLAYAKLTGKQVMVDFTGFGCVNCRKMEMAVWSDRRVRKLLTGDYVLISLYVDDKTRLPEPIIVQENGKTTTLRTVGDRWSYLQRSKFGAQTQPFYVLLNQKGMPLCRSYSYDEDVDKYVDFLQKGLEQFRKQ